jgi:Family of unknown function (DUF5677)
MPTDGFLSSEVSISIERIKRQFAPWFRVAARFNSLGMRLLPCLKPETTNNQQLLVAAAFGRTLTSFQSALLLTERGLLADARTVIRSAAETAIFMAALAKDTSVGDILIKRHFYHHRKLRAAWLDDPQATAEMTPELIAAVAESIADIDKNYPNLRRDPLILGNLAGDGALIGLYNAVYRVASGDAAHISIDALNRHVRADAGANIQGLRFGPDISDLPDTISIAISTFGLSLFTAIELFGLQEFNDELRQCMEEWKALGIPAEYKAA